MAPYIIALLTALLVVLFVLEWRHQRRLSTRVHLMREALRNRDFMFRLPTDSIMPGERELQKMLNEMGGEINQLMARSEVESWQRLTRVLTHEIMNATTPISCISQAYMSSPAVKGTPLEEGIRAIHDTCASLNVFVDSYRKITQLQKAVITDVSLKPFFGGMSAMYANLRFSCDIEDDVTIRADENMLRQVMANLTKNAVEAGAHRMDIRLRQQDDHTDILVSNDGQVIVILLFCVVFHRTFSLRVVFSELKQPSRR